MPEVVLRPVSLPEEALPATLELNPDLHMSDDDFYEFCMANPDLWFERTAEGEIIIVPPVGLESNDRESEVTEQLRQWAKRDGRGRGFGATAEFMLPTGAAYSPDAAWVSNARLADSQKNSVANFLRSAPSS